MSKSDVDQSSTTEDANDVGVAPAAKPTFWQRFKAHMKKWWWVYLIAFGCIVLVVVLPM